MKTMFEYVSRPNLTLKLFILTIFNKALTFTVLQPNTNLHEFQNNS